jgi:rubrerythrin
MIANNKALVQIVIDKEVNELLENYSKKLDLSKSKLVRNMIYFVMDSECIYNNLGDEQAVSFLRDLLDGKASGLWRCAACGYLAEDEKSLCAECEEKFMKSKIT